MKKPSASSEFVLRQGDVVIVPFPYTDQLAEKRRPALVVSGNTFNKRFGLVWVAMITSADNPSWPGDIALPERQSGLGVASVIRPAKLATLDSSRVVSVAGRIDSATRQAVAKSLTMFLG